MSADINTILALKSELDVYADSLREARTRLSHHKNILDAAWHANEISMIDDAIEEIDRKLSRTADELNDIASDMVKAHQQIEEEQIAREQRERRRQQEQERLAREQATQRAREQEIAAAYARKNQEKEEQQIRMQTEGVIRKQEQTVGEAKQSTDKNTNIFNFATNFFSWLFRR